MPSRMVSGFRLKRLQPLIDVALLNLRNLLQGLEPWTYPVGALQEYCSAKIVCELSVGYPAPVLPGTVPVHVRGDPG